MSLKVRFLKATIDFSIWRVKPRPETRFWVRKAILELQKSKKGKFLKVLDLFSGTGCIGVSILKNLPKSFVVFGDIEKSALFQIKTNLKLNRIKNNRFQLLETDIFSKVKGKYDVIFANPPYVAKERWSELQESVKKEEPRISWDGGERGLALFKKFLPLFPKYLKKQGICYFELDSDQISEISHYLKKQNLFGKFLKDQFGKLRWCRVQKD
jgi:release factor glutamine methyltransferase